MPTGQYITKDQEQCSVLHIFRTAGDCWRDTLICPEAGESPLGYINCAYPPSYKEILRVSGTLGTTEGTGAVWSQDFHLGPKLSRNITRRQDMLQTAWESASLTPQVPN